MNNINLNEENNDDKNDIYLIYINKKVENI